MTVSSTVAIDLCDVLTKLIKDLGFSRSSAWYIKRRVKHEGVKFVTVILPSLSKHVLRCLELGAWTPYKGPCPVKTRGSQRYTAFMADELVSIFERGSDDRDRALNLWRVRQLLEYAYKLALPFDQSCLDQAALKFLATDASLTFDRDFAERVRANAEMLYPSAFKLQFHEIARQARFGPGTFAGYDDGSELSLQDKKDNLDGVYDSGLEAFSGFFRKSKTSIFNFSYRAFIHPHVFDLPLAYIATIPLVGIGIKTVSLRTKLRRNKVKTRVVSYKKQVFPHLHGWYSNIQDDFDELFDRANKNGNQSQVGFTIDSQTKLSTMKLYSKQVSKPVSEALLRLRRSETLNSEVLFVPKDSRGPRTIVREPASNIYIQMGFHERFKTALERDTNGRIQFTSQEEFRDLARRSSQTKEFATLDLSEASDSVSAGLAYTIFQNCPAFRTCFNVFRTVHSVLPNGSRVRLRKLAGMGSGFTFPCMAGIIYAAIYTGLPKVCQKAARPLIYVYGDDIIVPTSFVDFAVSALRKVGLTVNSDKSYYRSNFRESCGGDYLHGDSVAPVRLKQTFCSMRTKGTRVLPLRHDVDKFVFKLERHCRELVQSGLSNLADYYYNVIERYLGVELPVGNRFDASPLMRFVNRFVPHNWNECRDISVIQPTVQVKQRNKKGINLSFVSFLHRKDEVIFDDPVLIGLTAERYKVSLTAVDEYPYNSLIQL